MGGGGGGGGLVERVSYGEARHSVCCGQNEVTDATVRQLVDVTCKCTVSLSYGIQSRGGINVSGAATQFSCTGGITLFLYDGSFQNIPKALLKNAVV